MVDLVVSTQKCLINEILRCIWPQKVSPSNLGSAKMTIFVVRWSSVLEVPPWPTWNHHLKSKDGRWWNPSRSSHIRYIIQSYQGNGQKQLENRERERGTRETVSTEMCWVRSGGCSSVHLRLKLPPSGSIEIAAEAQGWSKQCGPESEPQMEHQCPAFSDIFRYVLQSFKGNYGSKHASLCSFLNIFQVQYRKKFRSKRPGDQAKLPKEWDMPRLSSRAFGPLQPPEWERFSIDLVKKVKMFGDYVWCWTNYGPK